MQVCLSMCDLLKGPGFKRGKFEPISTLRNSKTDTLFFEDKISFSVFFKNVGYLQFM